MTWALSAHNHVDLPSVFSDSLIAVPLSGKERAFLDPPDQVVLNFWDITLESTHRQVCVLSSRRVTLLIYCRPDDD